jgi:hypothetical protein
MRTLLLIIVAMLGLNLGGCAVPRSIWLHAMVPNDLPVVEGGARTETQIFSSVMATSPGGRTTIAAPLPVVETQSWYERTFEKRGWKNHGNHQCQDGTTGVDYQRQKGFYIGEAFIDLGYESLSLEVRPNPAGGSTVDLYMFGFYYWDMPSRLAFVPVLWTLGESHAAEMMAFFMSWM